MTIVICRIGADIRKLGNTAALGNSPSLFIVRASKMTEILRLFPQGSTLDRNLKPQPVTQIVADHLTLIEGEHLPHHQGALQNQVFGSPFGI
jgi:hypothetical protein